MLRLKNITRAVVIAASLFVAVCPAQPAQGEPAQQQTVASVLPAGFSEETLRLPETNLHYVWGGNGPVVILLHGFPEDWSAWRKVAPQLADRFPVIAPDLRGLLLRMPHEQSQLMLHARRL